MSNRNLGCLGFLFSWMGGAPAQPEVLPYKLRDRFLTPAEASFFQVLRTVVQDQYYICPKVNLGDIFYVSRPNENFAYRNKIDRKHVDFLLCHPETMKPVMGIELDDSSHNRQDRQKRDLFVNEVFRAARLPLVRFPVKTGYSVQEVAAALSGQTKAVDGPAPVKRLPTGRGPAQK